MVLRILKKRASRRREMRWPVFAKTRCCPHCEYKSLQRSQRKGWLEACLSLVGFYPFRCKNYTCNKRFFLLSRS